MPWLLLGSLFFLCVVQNKGMNQKKGFITQKAIPLAYLRSVLQEEAKKLKEVSPCLKEWLDGKTMSVLPGQAQGLILPLSAGSLPIKIIPSAECREDKPTAY